MSRIESFISDPLVEQNRACPCRFCGPKLLLAGLSRRGILATFVTVGAMLHACVGMSLILTTRQHAHASVEHGTQLDDNCVPNRKVEKAYET